MEGPIANFAPGQRSRTAWAITCAVEWRRTARPSSVSAVMMATVAPSGSGRLRSCGRSSTIAATAAFASPRPIDAAKSAAVLPPGSVRAEPSGRVTVIPPLVLAIAGRWYRRSARGPLLFELRSVEAGNLRQRLVDLQLLATRHHLLRAQRADELGRSPHTPTGGEERHHRTALRVAQVDRVAAAHRELIVERKMAVAPRRIALVGTAAERHPVGHALVHPRRDRRPRDGRDRDVVELVGERADLVVAAVAAEVAVLDVDARGGRLPVAVADRAVRDERDEVVEVERRLQDEPQLVDRGGQDQRHAARPGLGPPLVEPGDG